ncbi:MAG TPA: hypothetical protein VGP64_11755 [Polyangia bacterium]
MTDEPAVDALEHIADRAAILAAAPTSDGERRSAEKHAEACLPCREALAEAVRLNALLKRVLRASVGDL